MAPAGTTFCVYDRTFPGLPWMRTKQHEWKVYVLIDPRDNTVRYVGITRDVQARRKNHLSSQAANWHMAEWKIELHKLRLVPLMAVIDSAPPERIRAREQHWIRYYRHAGYRLLNVAIARKHLRKGWRSIPVVGD